MTKLEGITPDESVFHSIRCTNQNLWGDLVITNKGIVFLTIKGVLGDNRERLHQFAFDEIHRIQTEKKESGIYRHGIVIDHHSESLENHTYHYACEGYKANLFLALFERQKLSLKTREEIISTLQSLAKPKRDVDLLKIVKNPKMRSYFLAVFLEEIEAEILSLLKHRYDIDLFEVATNQPVHPLIAQLHESDPKVIPQDQVYYTVTDLVAHLILRGELDGIVTDAGRYVSDEALARIPIPFEMLADFETIFSQLKERGLLIWTLECSTCFRKIKYPKNGKEITCGSCGATVYAIDIFKQFKDLL